MLMRISNIEERHFYEIEAFGMVRLNDSNLALVLYDET